MEENYNNNRIQNKWSWEGKDVVEAGEELRGGTKEAVDLIETSLWINVKVGLKFKGTLLFEDVF